MYSGREKERYLLEFYNFRPDSGAALRYSITPRVGL